MKHCIKTGVRRLGVAAFWGVALLVLPNCGFDASGNLPPENLDEGSFPRSSAIFCDIEVERRCATDQDLIDGIPMTRAAVALNTGPSNGNIGLDYSPDAISRCLTPAGIRPEAVVFRGPFPDGLPVCLNCGVIGTTYADFNEACQARCYDFYGTVNSEGGLIPDVPPTDATRDYCDAHSRASTNLVTCVGGACPDYGGDVNDGFIDPRRTPDEVQWTDRVGTSDGPGTLTRTATTTGAYDAGAVSTQWFRRGDGYVEFGAGSVTDYHVIGLSQIPALCAFPCPDTSQDYTTIGYAFDLAPDGFVYIYLAGSQVTGPGPNGSFATYTVMDRFRVSVAAVLDGSARITFGKVIGSCTPGMPCSVMPLYSVNTDRYPLRVDTAFLGQGTTLTDVRVVYIK